MRRSRPRQALMRRYAAMLGVVTAFGLALGVCVNLLVDPDARFDLLRVKGFNAEKVAVNNERDFKARRLASGQYDVLLAGTSRALVGLDPAGPAFAGRRVLNIGLSETNMLEMEQVLRFALEHQQPGWLVWGLDFLAFNERRGLHDDFAHSGFGSADPIRGASSILSAGTFARSVETVAQNADIGEEAGLDEAGFFDKTGLKVDHRRLFTSVLAKNMLVEPGVYGAFRYGPDRLRRFAGVIDAFAARGVKVDLFISPVHARELEALQALGLWSTFEAWKRDLTRIVDAAREHSRAPIALWDFSGFNSITTEAVPPLGDRQQMRWYWESSHYKKEVGALMMARMTGRALPELPRDFGQWLDGCSIGHALLKVRRDQEAYQEHFAYEVSEVQRLVAATEGERERRQVADDLAQLKGSAMPQPAAALPPVVPQPGDCLASGRALYAGGPKGRLTRLSPK